MKGFATLSVLLLLGCTPHVVRPVAPVTNVAITLAKRPLDLRLIQPAIGTDKPTLVLFATGDGGWRNLDQEVVARIAEHGYAVVGFNARQYLKTMNEVSDATTPPKLAADFQRIIEFAITSMNLPRETPIILVGISRGAGLVSIAAGQETLRNHVEGIIAIALASVEEHVMTYHRRSARRSEWVAVETYRYLRQLSNVPVEILQSTHDKYTTAAKARELFGADTPLHHLRAIDAKSHTFGGAVPALLTQLNESLVRLTAY